MPVGLQKSALVDLGINPDFRLLDTLQTLFPVWMWSGLALLMQPIRSTKASQGCYFTLSLILMMEGFLQTRHRKSRGCLPEVSLPTWLVTDPFGSEAYRLHDHAASCPCYHHCPRLPLHMAPG